MVPDSCYTIGLKAIDRKETVPMQQRQAWKLLVGIFAVFWVVFAIFLFIAELPFYIISIALTTIFVLSIAVIALAWAYQNNF
jgi:flagellar biosynthesis component FlhA